MAHKGKATSDVNYNPTDPPEAYSNATVHSRLSEYNLMATEVNGPYIDPSTEPIDGEVVMRVGGGKKHGRYWIGDSLIDTASTPTLAQIRARSTGSSPATPTSKHYGDPDGGTEGFFCYSKVLLILTYVSWYSNHAI